MISYVVAAAMMTMLVGPAVGQVYYGCDYYQPMDVNRWYDVFSPQFPNNYPVSSQCRWTGAASAGYIIAVNCTVMSLPVSSGCTGDRLEISYAGRQDLADAQKFCGAVPFLVYSTTNVIVLSLKLGPSSPGGRFFCQIQARLPSGVTVPPPPPSSPPQPAPSIPGTVGGPIVFPGSPPVQAGTSPIVFPPPAPTATPAATTASCDCGRKKSARIVNGVATLTNEYPFMGGIMEVTTKRVIGGCTIIDPNYCLTSAHLVVNRTLADIALIVGEQDYNIGSDTPYTAIYRFLAFIPYPSFDPVSNLNDLAIMRIYGQIQFNAGVSAVCLPFSNRLNQNSFVYSQLDAVGWGRTSFGGVPSSTLNKVSLTVIPNTDCNRSYPYQISSAQMCTFTALKDTCDLDDGGPLFFYDTVLGRVYHVGVISYGTACASNMPRVHTRVTSYLSWIQSTTNGTANLCVI